MSKRISTRKISETMRKLGMPATDARYANIYRAAVKAGLTEDQAFALTRDAFYAANQYEWQLSKGSRLHLATVRASAEAHPHGKCAEDLAAAEEQRPSRWGTPEFHRVNH